MGNETPGNSAKDDIYMNSDSEFETSSPKKNGQIGSEGHVFNTNHGVDRTSTENLLPSSNLIEPRNKSSILLPTVHDDLTNLKDVSGDTLFSSQNHSFTDLKDHANLSDVNQSSDLDAESTILKVTEFINGKREELAEKEERLKPFSKGVLKNDRFDLQNSNTNHKGKGDFHADMIMNVHRHRSKSSSDFTWGDSVDKWSKEDWLQLYNYLKMFKRTHKHSMMDVRKLEKTFNCDLIELELRVKALKNTVKKKKRMAFRKKLDRIIGDDLE